MRVIFALAIMLWTMPAIYSPPAWALIAGEELDDPALESRARAISKELRCLVCQNQSIDDSNAGLAKDLRGIVRERLLAGDSDQQVNDYVVARYGDFVLLRPPFKASTYALWLGPGVILLLGLIGAGAYIRRQSLRAAEAAPLDDYERKRLKTLLDDS